MNQKHKYIWAIGDIHGKYDMLRALMKEVQTTDYHKIIFLGDYIDRGKKTRLVLDYLKTIQDKSVFLLGNHEEMLLDGCFDSKALSLWLLNGGNSTVKSFGYEGVAGFVKTFCDNYLDFFLSMKVIHNETINDKNHALNLYFAHAGIDNSLPLNIFTNMNYEGFVKYREKYNKISPLWMRESFLNNLSPNPSQSIVIHGHTPTQKINLFVNNLTVSAEENENIEIDTNIYYKNLPFIRKNPLNQQVMSIDIDTGAGMGKRLTAIGFSFDNLLKIKGKEQLKVIVLQAIQEEEQEIEIKTNYFLIPL